MPLTLTDEWRSCQGRVNALEREYAATMLLYCRGAGPPPSDAMQARLRDMRAKAAALLSRALSDLDERAVRVDNRLSGVEHRSSILDAGVISRCSGDSEACGKSRCHCRRLTHEAMGPRIDHVVTRDDRDIEREQPAQPGDGDPAGGGAS